MNFQVSEYSSRLRMATNFLPQLSVAMTGLTWPYRAIHCSCACCFCLICKAAFIKTSGDGPAGFIRDFSRQHFLNFLPLPQGHRSFLPVTFLDWWPRLTFFPQRMANPFAF